MGEKNDLLANVSLLRLKVANPRNIHIRMEISHEKDLTPLPRYVAYLNFQIGTDGKPHSNKLTFTNHVAKEKFLYLEKRNPIATFHH